jgi:hypothetical protein
LQNDKFISLIVSATLTLGIMLGLTQVLGSPLQEVLVRMITYALYATFFVFVYVLRFALLFLGLVAAYRFIQKRSSKQTNHQEELQVFRSLSE